MRHERHEACHMRLVAHSTCATLHTCSMSSDTSSGPLRGAKLDRRGGEVGDAVGPMVGPMWMSACPWHLCEDEGGTDVLVTDARHSASGGRGEGAGRQLLCRACRPEGLGGSACNRQRMTELETTRGNTTACAVRACNAACESSVLQETLAARLSFGAALCCVLVGAFWSATSCCGLPTRATVSPLPQRAIP